MMFWCYVKDIYVLCCEQSTSSFVPPVFYLYYHILYYMQ